MNHFTKLWLLLQAFTPLKWTCLLYSDDTFYQYISPAFANLTTARFTGHTATQWNPVTTDTVGTCHNVSIIRVSVHESGHLEKKKFTDSWLIDVKTQTEFLNFVPFRKFFLPPDHSKQTSFLSKPKNVLKFTSFHPVFLYFYTVLKSTVLKREMRGEPSGIKREHQLRLTGLPLTRALEGFFLSVETLVFVDVNQLFPWFSHALWEGSRVAEWRAWTHSRPQSSWSLSSTCAEELWVEIGRKL